LFLHAYDSDFLQGLLKNKDRKCYSKLGNEIKNPENEFWIKLKPDMVVFVDNWRVLHGRSAFTGSRHVSGCYLPYDDWTSIARAFCPFRQKKCVNNWKEQLFKFYL
jgi:trimethyllysine dioxygenase